MKLCLLIVPLPLEGGPILSPPFLANQEKKSGRSMHFCQTETGKGIFWTLLLLPTDVNVSPYSFGDGP